MLKAVIFDMDGVLIDSEPMHAKVAMKVLQEYGVKVTKDYINCFIGTTTKRMFETMISDFHLDATVDELLALDSKILKKLHEVEGYPPIEGTKELILDLYKNGIKLAVASSSPAPLIAEVTKALGIEQYFTKLVSGAEVKHPKPAPDVFLKAAKELGVSVSECMIVEDSMNGVLAAESAGIKSIGFINPNSGKQDLSKAFVLIESFKDIGYKFILNEYKHAYGEPITIATTERLIIRELSTSDMKDLYQIYQQPEVNLYIDDNLGSLEEETTKLKAYIENVYGFYGYGLWGVFLKEDDSLIGRCGIQCNIIDGQTEIELGYLLDYNHWDYGYACECTTAILNYAFHELEMTRIVATIDKNNTRSIKLAERIGMKVEKEFLCKNRNCYLYVIESNNR